MTRFYFRYSDDYTDPDNCAVSYGVDQTQLVTKTRGVEGFDVQDADQIDDLNIKSFVDSSRKIVIDNTGSYGHFMATWMYALTSFIKSEQRATIIFYAKDQHPDQIKTGLVSVTKYLGEELTKRGHRVEYAETDKFYVNNFIHLRNPFSVPVHELKPVSDFLAENIDPQVRQGTEKIYLSRRKVEYSFIHRIDDEDALEEYLKSLGFEIVCPEDYDSYHDQLNKIASAKILMSLTSSGLSACLALAPNTYVIELSSYMHTRRGGAENEYDIRESTFHNQYKVMSMIRDSLYMSIPNMTTKTSDVVDFIEGNETLKALLSA